MEFKVGDLVEFKSWEEMTSEFRTTSSGNIDVGNVCFVDSMRYLCRKQYIIVNITEYQTIELRDPESKKLVTDWTITKEMLKLVKTNKGADMNLVNIYFERKEKELNKKFEEELENTKLLDENYKEFRDLQKKIKSIKGVVDSGFYTDFKFDDDMNAKLAELETKNQQDLKDLKDTKTEVEAQLEICENYEQKRAILKAYNIIDDNGKLTIK